MQIKRVGVVGTGVMGSGLVELAAKGGYEVVVRSGELARAEAMLDKLLRSIDRQVAKGRLEESEGAAVRERISATGSFADLVDCDLIVECVAEDLDTKLAVFAELNACCKPDTILATNTSTLPVVRMATATERPERVCGIHFFNPVGAMELVEIVRPLTASTETVEAAHTFARSLGKTTVEVLDRAGFVVNRLLFPYLNDAIRLLEEGVASRDDIDAAMKGGCNFPMGPFALLDLVGLDVSLAILEALYAELGEPRCAPRATLRRLVAAGQLGRKTGSGFYDY